MSGPRPMTDGQAAAAGCIQALAVIVITAAVVGLFAAVVINVIRLFT